MSQTVKLCLWFQDNAVEAAEFYADLFPGAEITATRYYTEHGPRPEGEVMAVEMKMFGHDWVFINGGEYFQMSPAVSFMIPCADQAEIDKYWNALTDGGQAMQCGWVTDKFGTTWQIQPECFYDLCYSDPSKTSAVTGALYQMVKVDIATLEEAHRSA